MRPSAYCNSIILIEALERRKAIESRYREALADVSGISLLPMPLETEGNASYFPIFIDRRLSTRSRYALSKHENGGH